MPLGKTISRLPRLKIKGLSLEIRCLANRRPLMSLLYAFQHARKHVIRYKNSNTSLYAHKLTAQIRDLGATATDLKGSNDINPNDLSDSINSSIKTYVDLFYNINKDERKEYLALFNNGKKSKIKPERNLLIIPALMAELKQPKEEIAQALFYSLYRMPFKILDDSRRSAFSIALLKRNMAITSVSSDVIDKFAKSMVKFESRMKAIEGGEIDPPDDEDIKEDFIEKAIELSRTSEINIVDLVAEKVGTEGTTRMRMNRIIRRARY